MVAKTATILDEIMYTSYSRAHGRLSTSGKIPSNIVIKQKSSAGEGGVGEEAPFTNQFSLHMVRM